MYISAINSIYFPSNEIVNDFSLYNYVKKQIFNIFKLTYICKFSAREDCFKVQYFYCN